MININEDTQHEIYTTSDLPLAAVFSLYFPLDSVGRSTAPRLTFNFKVSPDAANIEDQYRMGDLTVEPRKYFDQIKYLKSLLYS